jgi:hypothetical protein
MSNRGKVFCVRFVPRCFKQDIWSNELVVRQSSAGKNLSKEAEDVIGIRYQAVTGEDIANREDFLCAVVTVIFGVCNSVRLSYLFVITFCRCSVRSQWPRGKA